MGFPQESSSLPPNLKDTLANKPRCQFDDAYKVGLGLAALLTRCEAEKLAPRA
jgi:hypothetical protein